MDITATSVEEMSYVQFISLIRETNRCPGGKKSIGSIIQKTFLNRDSTVLEIGSNTGFTSLEIARTAKCKVFGIDPVEEAVVESNRIASEDAHWIQDCVNFRVGSAYDIPFKDNFFDLVVVGGATSFMDQKNRAINEYFRVMKPWGFLSVTNLFYHDLPPKKVLSDVSDILGVPIEPWVLEDWKRLFSTTDVRESYSFTTHPLNFQSSDTLDQYVEYFLQKPHIKLMSDDVRKAIELRWRKTLDIFNENHKYLGYFSAIFRKRYLPEEPELFT